MTGFRGVLLILGVLFLGGCAGCSAPEEKLTCEDRGDCKVNDCPNVPRIVRTAFDPKDGRVPFTVTFNVVAEDADTIVCNETLTYHFDCDSDGDADVISNKGRAECIYDTSGKKDIKIWVTDSGDPVHVSKTVTKFVMAEDNQPPVITGLAVFPTVGVVGGNPFLIDFGAQDPDSGYVAAIKVDFGDGSPILILDGAQSATTHQYYKAGQFTITVTAVDGDGAQSSRSAVVSVVINSLPSSMIQTVGSSQAIALDDNDGQYFTDAGGPFLYGYVADGPIALKTVKYPLSAFSAAPQGVAELIGWADPGNYSGERWDDIVVYKNLAVVSGSEGFQVFNVRAAAGGRTCTRADYEQAKARYAAGEPPASQHCYPGTPTQPAAICSPGGGFTGGMKVRGLQLLYPSGRPGEVWAVGNNPAGSSWEGGFDMVRLDGMVSDDYFIASSAGCWNHLGRDSGWRGNASALAKNTTGMVIDGDYAYLGALGPGFFIVNVGEFTSNRMNTLSPAFQLDYLPGYAGMQNDGYGVALAKGRPVAGTLYPGDFRPFTEHYSRYAYWGEHGACAEVKTIESATYSLGATEAVLHIDPVSSKGILILPGNRVAIDTPIGTTDDNGGLGYLVSRIDTAAGDIVLGYGNLPTAPVADWLSVKTIPISVGVLPAYPGRNPVVISTAQAGSLALNAVCRNFINAYAAITEPVGVQYQSAPLGFLSLVKNLNDGMLVFDQSNPAVPDILGFVPGRAPQQMIARENYLYMSGTSKVFIVDISDPYHLNMDALATSTHCAPACPAEGDVDFSINRMEYVTTPTNPKGVLLIPGGAAGMNALDVADALAAPGFSANCSAADPASNSCYTKAASLQLGHEGLISDIQLIGNDYALVAQKRGGVLVFDIKGIPYGGAATFVSHIRTTGNPGAIRVVTDATGPKSLWIADSTSFYRIAFTNPARPGISQRVSSPGKFNFNCVEYTNGRIFMCYSEIDPATGFTMDKAWFSNGDTVPATRIAIAQSSTDSHSCVPDSSIMSSGFTGLSTALLAGRFMMFVQSGGGSSISLRELPLDGNGAIIKSGSPATATGCWWPVPFIGSYNYYQERTGVNAWKRLYTAASGGYVQAFNIDGFEQELADPTFGVNTGPAILGSRDLSLAVGGEVVYVTKLVAVGPYLFIAGSELGAFVIDASRPENMPIIGQTSVSTGPVHVGTLNAMAYPDISGGPNYTYMVLLSDNAAGGGIRLVRFPGLDRP